MTAVEGRPARVTPGAGPLVWSSVAEPSAAFDCRHLHRPGGGRLDEAARRLSHEELSVALLLASEGHEVRSLAETRRGGRHPDLLACGTPLEVKSFAPAAERRREPTPYSVFNKLVDAAGQAAHVVLVGTGSGLSADTARRGVARYAGDRSRGPTLSSVRIVGDGYDLAWGLGAGLEAGPAPPGRRVGLSVCRGMTM